MYHSGGELSVSWNQLEIRVWKFFYVKVYYGEIQVEAIQAFLYGTSSCFIFTSIVLNLLTILTLFSRLVTNRFLLIEQFSDSERFCKNRLGATGMI